MATIIIVILTTIITGLSIVEHYNKLVNQLIRNNERSLLELELIKRKQESLLKELKKLKNN
jgi:hypothetical protein